MRFQILLENIINRIDKKEKLLFFLFSLLSIIPLYLLNYIPSLDGPQHLYISNVIVRLLESNDTIGQIFKFNNVIVGNWIGHFLLSFFNLLFPAALAEKFLLSAYYLGIAFSYRYLIISISGKSSFLSFIIFPFATTTLVLLGYYNYSFASIILFITLGYWLRIEKNNLMNTKHFIMLMVLFILLFLSHVFVFLLCGLVLAIYFIKSIIVAIVNKTDRHSNFRKEFKKIAFVFLAAIPGLVFWINYVIVVSNRVDLPIKRLSFEVLSEYLVIIRSLMAFHGPLESPGTISLFILINLIVILSLVLKFRTFIRAKKINNSSAFFLKSSDFWLLISFVFLVLYYTFPDQLTSGNISNRISIVMFFLLIVWIGIQEIPRWLSLVFAILFIAITVKQRVVHFQFLSALDKEIVVLKELDDSIDENSTIVSLGNSDNWIELHFCYYLGVDKPIAFLYNPQCEGQFPMVWNYQRVPPQHLGLKMIYDYEGPHIGVSGIDYLNRKMAFVDYVLIVWPSTYFKDDKNQPIIKVLEKFYTKHFVSSNNRYELYKFKAQNELNVMIEGIKQNEDLFNSVRKEAEDRKFSVENMLMFEALNKYDRNN